MNSKLFWPDYLKVLSIFLVILLHTSMPYIYRFNSIPLTNWYIANIFDSFSRMAVPNFFMISGALYLSRPCSSAWTFYKAKFKMLIPPLIFWSIIYLLWNQYYLNNNTNFFNQIWKIALYPQFYHLWFIYALICVYLIYPLAKKYIESVPWNFQMSVLFLSLIFTSILPLFISISFKSYLYYLQYFLLGYYLDRKNITKSMYFSCLLLFFLSTLTTIHMTYHLSSISGRFVEFFYDYFSLSTFLQSISFFMLAKHFKIKSDKIKKIYMDLAPMVFGVYLIHPLLLTIFNYSRVAISPLLIIPLVTFIIFFISFLLIFFLRKSKIARFFI